ncbi:hypothetical protein ACIHJG_34325 [Streptomyces sp. NPDC052415]|uniref:hypothetical protein n=1 Tax=Streptomyces sp. NPDC052415 TaxID=3365690 RepID=UPI0037D21362
MIVRQRLTRAVVATALGLAVAAGGLATASTAQAADTGHTRISCSAVKIRKAPSRSATVVGIGYRGNKVAYDQWVYKRAEKRWYTRGTVKRSDGKTIRGYMVYACANPYGTNPAPTPDIPK